MCQWGEDFWDGIWDKATRRHRLGTLTPDRALLIQDGVVRAVADVVNAKLVWTESGKLNKTGIFVTLEPRSEYERR